MVACLWHFVISSFRLALFRLFVISRGVYSLFRLFAWRYFVLVPRHNSRRKDEKTKLRNGTNKPPYKGPVFEIGS